MSPGVSLSLLMRMQGMFPRGGGGELVPTREEEVSPQPECHGTGVSRSAQRVLAQRKGKRTSCGSRVSEEKAGEGSARGGKVEGGVLACMGQGGRGTDTWKHEGGNRLHTLCLACCQHCGKHPAV